MNDLFANHSIAFLVCLFVCLSLILMVNLILSVYNQPWCTAMPFEPVDP